MSIKTQLKSLVIFSTEHMQLQWSTPYRGLSSQMKRSFCFTEETLEKSGESSCFSLFFFFFFFLPGHLLPSFAFRQQSPGLVRWRLMKICTRARTATVKFEYLSSKRGPTSNPRPIPYFLFNLLY